MLITVSGVTNPTSAKTITGFTVGTYRDDAIIDQSTNLVSYQATVGTLTVTLTPSNTQTGLKSVYTFAITLGDGITSTSILFITFPSEFNMATGSFVCTSNQSSNPSCAYNSINRRMTVTSFTSTPLASTNGISLAIQDIINPSMIGVFSSLSLTTTYSSTTDLVDTITSGVSFALTPRSLSKDNVTLTSSNYTVYALATLTFTITNLNPILANSDLFIGYPPEVTPTTAACQINSNGISCSLTTYNSYTGFYIPAVVTSDLASTGLSSFPVSLSGIYMPTSTKPSSSFQIYIIYPDSSVSEFLTTGLTITAMTPCSFSQLSISSSSNVNYANSVFTISVTPLFSISNNSILQITVPSLMTTTTSCSAGTGVNSVACTNTSTTVNAVLGFSSAQTGPTAMTIMLNNVKNYPTLAQYQIQVQLLDTTGTYQSSLQSFSLMNTLPNLISQSSSFSPAIMGELTTLSFGIVPSIALPSDGFILITFPSEFTLGSPSCTLPSGLFCSKTGSQINITSSTSYTFPINGAISGITAPKMSPSSSIYI